MSSERSFGGAYRDEHLARVAFPLGGVGAGMICLDGTGALSQVSLRHRPDLLNEPLMFAALHVEGPHGAVARVVEGPVPAHKPLVFRHEGQNVGSGSGAPGYSYGLPRFRDASFEARFPFATVDLRDDAVPVTAAITGWSPFIPGCADDSSLPMAALEYRLANPGDAPLRCVFSFHAANPVFDPRGAKRGVRTLPQGFVLSQDGSDECPQAEGSFAVRIDAPEARVHARWFRGDWFDPLTLLWKQVSEGEAPAAEPWDDGRGTPRGASLYVPFELAAGEAREIPLRLYWYVPHSDLRTGPDAGDPYRPWIGSRYPDVDALVDDAEARHDDLRRRTAAFRDAFFDTDLPPEVVEAVSANLSILRSPTLLRQSDGRIWAWEGCSDREGCCAGSCTHVWNYAQALPHLFPELERTLRETELGECIDERGHCAFRAPLPIRPAAHASHAAADGQLGGLLKLYRDWRISGDTDWLRRLWPKARLSLEHAIASWDPDREGVLREPHHNTYDIEFWGPDAMCSSIYVAALEAAARMAEATGDDGKPYRELAARGRERIETELFDGEHFVQRVQWRGLRAPPPTEFAAELPGTRYSPEARELLEREGPKYQYGGGCLADGVIGSWLGAVCGLGETLDPARVESHLRAVHRHNLRHDLSAHANPQRSGYAFGDEGGLLLCTWPAGGRPTLPFVYSEEVWTGIEYQVASHLILHGRVEEGLEIVRTARSRYDGRRRNPFDEIECGHFYARALASYALLQALSGARYDAVDRVLHLTPALAGDFRAFLCTATGFGSVGVRDGEPFLEVRSGEIAVDEIRYAAAPA